MNCDYLFAFFLFAIYETRKTREREALFCLVLIDLHLFSFFCFRQHAHIDSRVMLRNIKNTQELRARSGTDQEARPIAR